MKNGPHFECQQCLQNNRMSEKQDVLKAILNVKKYTKALKRNATTIQEINYEEDQLDEVASSPSCFEGRKEEDDEEEEEVTSCRDQEVASPLMFSKSSFEEAHCEQRAQKKDLSMTVFPKKKDMLRRNGQKLKSSHGSEYRNSVNKSAKSHQLSHTTKFEYVSSSELELKSDCFHLAKESKNRSFQKKKAQKLELKNPYERAQLGEEEHDQLLIIPSLNRRNSHKSSSNAVHPSLKTSCKKPMPSAMPDEELVRELLGEVEYLKGQLGMYKHAFLLVKGKYLETEGKAKEKVQGDHLIETLKLEIRSLQEDNQRLTVLIEVQNCKISNFHSQIASVSAQLMERYQQQTSSLVKIETQNAYLRDLTSLKHSAAFQVAPQPPEAPPQSCPSSVSSQSSDSETDVGCFQAVGICRSESDLQKKYESR